MTVLARARSCVFVVLAVAVAAVAIYGCAEPLERSGGAPSASPAFAPVRVAIDESVVPPPRASTPNPLGLPPATVTLAAGQRVFVVPERMLRGAAIGSSFALVTATVVAMDAEDVVVRVGHEATFKVHPGYVVVPRAGRFERGALVFAAYKNELHHGVVERFARRQVVVRFTDLGAATITQETDRSVIGALRIGLAPGGYAIAQVESTKAHVLLVSENVRDGGESAWLVLGAAGAAMLIPTGELQALPSRKLPEVGNAVLVAWRGAMVPGTVGRTEPLGIFTVRRSVLGAPLVVGPDMLTSARE
ncbi:MAG: hypothetical protein EXR75_09640 [Myxococcales bacterium]|nr:hypothetical protein [Myxococcales bacterium]